MASAKQKAAARKNIKKALAALRKKKSSSNKFKRKPKKMAKRRRRSPSRFTRFRRRAGRSSGLKATAILLASGIYGALRARASNALAPIVSKIPLGSIADEAAMFGISWILHKKTSGILKQVGLMGMAVEGARIGEAVISGNILSANGVSPALVGMPTLG